MSTVRISNGKSVKIEVTFTIDEVKEQLPRKVAYLRQVKAILATTPKSSPNWLVLAKSHDQAILDARKMMNYLNRVKRAEQAEAEFINFMIAIGQSKLSVNEIVESIFAAAGMVR